MDRIRRRVRIAWLLLFPIAAFGQPRQFAFSLRDPITDMESSAEAYVFLQQGIGAATDRIAPYLDSNSLGQRWGLLLGGAYLNLVLGHYSHELGHDLADESLFTGVQRRLNWSAWSPGPWPRYERSHTGYQPVFYRPISDPARQNALERNRQSYMNGLNLEEWDARRLRFSVWDDGLRWDEALAYLFRKWSAATYELYSGTAWSEDAGIGDSDVEAILQFYADAGMRPTRGAYYTQAILGTVLSAATWEAFATGIGFIRGKGFESSQPQTGQGFRWGWPLVESYFMVDGGFASMLWPMGWNGFQIWAGYGQDLDFLWSGKLQWLRSEFRLQSPYWRSNGAGDFSLSLGGTLNQSRQDFGFQGGALGSGLHWRLGWLGVEALYRYSHEDLLYQRMMFEPSGSRMDVRLLARLR